MNIVSCVSIITAVLFIVLINRRANGSRIDKINVWSFIVCGFLAWWNFCDAFFFSAKTIELARFWHHLGAIGWCGFIPVTVYYFLVMAEIDKKMKLWSHLLFWIPWSLLLIRCIFFMPTPLASDFVQSESGLGWTFVSSYKSIWLYIFLIMLISNFGITFFLLYRKYKNVKTTIDMLSMTKGFILLDGVSIGVGFITNVLLPIFTSFLPPISFVSTLIFLFGYRSELWELDLMHVELALNPNSIFESSPDAMLITDNNFTILFANIEANNLLNTTNLNQCNLNDYFDESSKDALKITDCNLKTRFEKDLMLTSGIPVNCSINLVTTKHHKKSVYIVSLHDISSLTNAQNKLEYLANYDELTALPNRRLLMKMLKEKIDNCTNASKDLKILFLDIDNFKNINDCYGHNAGDLALKTIAEALSKIKRDGDIAARLAGDEFVFVSTINSSENRNVEKEISFAVSSIDCSSFAPTQKLSISIGTSYISESKEINTLFKLADERMYNEKKSDIRS